jgi:ribosome biogenesis GTPase
MAPPAPPAHDGPTGEDLPDQVAPLDAAPGHADEVLRTLGWSDRVHALWASTTAGLDAVVPGATTSADTVPGRVIRTSRRFTYVATAEGLVQAIAPLDLEPAPVAGDWVVLDVDEDDEEGVGRLVAVLPRWSELSRRDPSGRSESQVLAADVDVVLIVLGLDRPIKAGRVERSLVLAWESGAQPAIVLTKADACDDPEAPAAEVRSLASDVDVHVLSSRTGEGVDGIRALLGGDDAAVRTVVLLGESGAGKSTLVNRLAGQEVQRTADVRAGDAKGRHTTVTRDLIVLPAGGVLIDTPGLRSLGLLDAEDGLSATFGDIEERAGACRFRDCRHASEPGCAVRAAVDAGEIDAERVDRYLAMQLELDDAAQAQTDAERRRTDRIISRSRRGVQRLKYGED